MKKTRRLTQVESVSDNKSAYSWVNAVFMGLLAAVFGVLAHWVIFESDLFWQVRAGREILQNWHVQTVDSWSHTAKGEPWYNFQWLSTVVVYLVHRLGRGYEALGWFRSFLVFSWMLEILGLLWLSRVRMPGLARFTVPIILAPWVYVMCWFRLQMRPDLFAACFYVGLLLIWSAELTQRRRHVLSIGLLLVWANFHSGTVVVGIFVFFLFLLTGYGKRRDFREIFFWALAGGACLFLTPQGFRILEVLRQNVFEYNYAMTGNPDQQPFRWDLLQFHKGGWSLLLWVIYTAVAALGYLFLWSRLERLPALYRSRPLVLIGGTLLTAMVVSKIRAIHYQVVFLLPVVAAAANYAWERLSKRRGLLAVVWAMPAFFLWGWAIPDLTRFVAKPIGSGLWVNDLPVEAVAFLKREKPQGALLNSYGFGGYLIAELPEYPVSIDGRELPFLKFREEMEAAKAGGVDAYRGFLSKYQINIVLELPPGTFFQPGKGFSDTHQLLYPSEEWAQVFFDNASVLYVRKIPRNAALIQKWGFNFVRRGLPANFAASFKGVLDEVRHAFEIEFDQCLRNSPENFYCLVGKSAFLRVRGQIREALELVLHAKRINPHSVETWLELEVLYKELGSLSEADQAKRSANRLANFEN